jgi:hypothetical protein
VACTGGEGELFLHGYLREVRRDGRLALPSGRVRAQVVITWESNAGTSYDYVTAFHSGGSVSIEHSKRKPKEQVLNVDYDARHGGFSVRTTVPLTARAGEHRLVLRALLSDGDNVTGAAGVFVGGGPSQAPGQQRTLDALLVRVAGPRPPSVSLTATLPPGAARVLHPGGKLRLAVQISTLSGIPVGSARVTMRWRIQPKPAPPGCAYCQAEGSWNGGGWGGKGRSEWADAAPELLLSVEEDCSMGAYGSLQIDWAPLTHASRPLTLGDSLHLSFEWLGPAHEIITATLDLPVALSERSLSIVPQHRLSCPKSRLGRGCGWHSPDTWQQGAPPPRPRGCG